MTSLPPGTSDFMRTVSRASGRDVARHLERHPQVNVDALEPGGTTALIVTCSSCNADTVRVLLKARADPNLASPDDGCTPLLAAADGQAMEVRDGQGNDFKGLEPHDDLENEMAQYASITRMLLTAQADPTGLSRNGCSPLWIAAQNGNSKLLEVLLRDGRDDPTRAAGRRHCTPLYAACSNGHVAAAAALLRDPRVAVDCGGALPPFRTADGTKLLPPLWSATFFNFANVCELLLRHGAEEGVLAPLAESGGPTFYRGRTLLHAVCIQGVERGDFKPPWVGALTTCQSLSLLLARMAQLGDRGPARGAPWLEAPDPLGATPLALALACGNVLVAACLLAIGADATHPSVDAALQTFAQESGSGSGGSYDKTASLGVLSITIGLEEAGLVDTHADEDDIAAVAPGRSGAPTRSALSPLIDSACGACASCGAKPKALKRCGRCKLVAYCNAECARAHWQEVRFGHKAMCGVLCEATNALPPTMPIWAGGASLSATASSTSTSATASASTSAAATSGAPPNRHSADSHRAMYAALGGAPSEYVFAIRRPSLSTLHSSSQCLHISRRNRSLQLLTLVVAPRCASQVREGRGCHPVGSADGRRRGHQSYHTSIDA